MATERDVSQKFYLKKMSHVFDERFTIMGDLDFVLKLSRISKGIPIKADLAIYRSHLENLSRKTKLTVQERTIWANEMLANSLFLKLITSLNLESSVKILISLLFQGVRLDFVSKFK